MDTGMAAPLAEDEVAQALRPFGSSRTLPATAYTSPAVLAWGRPQLFPGAWARGGRAPRLRGRRQLEGHRGELPRVLPLPVDPPRAVPGVPADLRRQLGPARRLGRRLDGPASTGRDDVDVGSERRCLYRRRSPEHRPLRGTLSEPAHLGASGLRTDPPAHPARPGPHPGGVRMA